MIKLFEVANDFKVEWIKRKRQIKLTRTYSGNSVETVVSFKAAATTGTASTKPWRAHVVPKSQHEEEEIREEQDAMDNIVKYAGILLQIHSTVIANVYGVSTCNYNINDRANHFIKIEDATDEVLAKDPTFGENVNLESLQQTRGMLKGITQDETAQSCQVWGYQPNLKAIADPNFDTCHWFQGLYPPTVAEVAQAHAHEPAPAPAPAPADESLDSDLLVHEDSSLSEYVPMDEDIGDDDASSSDSVEMSYSRSSDIL